MAAFKHGSLLVLLVLAFAVGRVSPASAAAGVTTLVSFDETAGDNPEGLAIDHRGTVYLSFPLTGEIRAISRDGTSRTYATLPAGPGFGPLGIAIDARGTLYVAVNTSDAATQGVYVVQADGSSSRLAGTDAITFPNDVALDPRGNVYVTDTSLGAVWRVPSGGGPAELWSQHDLLEGDNSGPLPVPLGANGIEYRQGALYVANTELARIVRIPVLRDGSAGTPAVFAQAPALGGADGMMFDVHGSLYVAVGSQNTIVRVSSDGTSISSIATAADGLDFPSAVAFGGASERQTLFIINFSITELFGGPSGVGPALLSMDAGVVGQPR